MTGEHPKGEVVALRAPLAVYAYPFPVLGTAAPPEVEVGFAERFEEGEQIIDRLVGEMDSIDPEVLVVANDWRLVVSENPSIAATHHELGIGNMGDALENGPLPRFGNGPQVGSSLFCQGTQVGGSLPLDLGGIVVAKLVEEVLLVGTWGRDRIGRVRDL